MLPDIVRWVARLTGLAAIVVIIVFAVNGRLMPFTGLDSIVGRNAVLLACLLTSSAGLVLAWWRENLGGAVVLMGMAMYYVFQLQSSGEVDGTIILIFIIPGGLFRISSWLTRRSRRRS